MSQFTYEYIHIPFEYSMVFDTWEHQRDYLVGIAISTKKKYGRPFRSILDTQSYITNKITIESMIVRWITERIYSLSPYNFILDLDLMWILKLLVVLIILYILIVSFKFKNYTKNWNVLILWLQTSYLYSGFGGNVTVLHIHTYIDSVCDHSVVWWHDANQMDNTTHGVYCIMCI